RILIVVNKNSNQQKFEFTLPGMYKVIKANDLVSGKEFEIKNNKLDVNIGGIEYLILKLEN
ncbi:MAG: hypothetical protein WAR59_12190, partial [Ignavibacteriaceae bacterium]